MKEVNRKLFGTLVLDRQTQDRGLFYLYNFHLVSTLFVLLDLSFTGLKFDPKMSKQSRYNLAPFSTG